MLIFFFFVLMPICTIIAIPLGIIKAKADLKEKKLKEERYQEELKYRQEMLKTINKG